MSEKLNTHWRKVFKTIYLGSADIDGPTQLTISKVTQEKDKTSRTQDTFNTAYFAEKEIRKGEILRPMILNVTNSRIMEKITGTNQTAEWNNVPVVVYVDKNSRQVGGGTGAGLRIKEVPKKPEVLPGTDSWNNAKNAYLRDENFDAVKRRANISQENELKIIQECADEADSI